MTTRNILDWQGEIVGTLDLPDDTPEEVWQEKLSAYNKPPDKTTAEIIGEKVTDAERFGRALLRQISRDNIMLGATTEQVNEMISVHKNIILMFMSGSLYTALEAVEIFEPNELLTQERLNNYSAQIKKYLGLPV